MRDATGPGPIRAKRGAWLVLLLPAAVCLPCLALPLLLLAGSTFLGALGSLVTGSLLIGTVLLLSSLALTGLVWRRRRHAATTRCAVSPAPSRGLEAHVID